MINTLNEMVRTAAEAPGYEKQPDTAKPHAVCGTRPPSLVF
jgi:hypothetical protein